MKKLKILLLVALLIVSFCSCGHKKERSIYDNLVLSTSSGDEISLYMNREDVESIVGESSSINFLGENEYDSFDLGFTNGMLTAIVIRTDSVSTLGGLTVGTDNYKDYAFDFPHIDKVGDMYFSHVDGKYEQEVTKLADSNIGEAALVSITLDDNKNIDSIYITDSNVARTAKFDK